MSTDAAALMSPIYLKEQINMLTSTTSGLHKRNPTELSGYPTQTIFGTTYVYEFKMGGALYFLVFREVSGFAIIDIINTAGFGYTINELDDATLQYIAGLAERGDLHLRVNGDTLFALNSKQIPLMDAEVRETENTSVVHVKQAPEDGTTLKVSYTDTADVAHTETIVVGSTQALRGTNFLASSIASTITTTAPTGITAVARGSVVALITANNSYAKVAVEDDQGNNVLVAINGTVETVLDLPKFLPGVQILKVQPNALTDKGIFYMKSVEDVSFTTPTPPTADATMTAGYANGFGYLVSGYGLFNPFGILGTMSPPLTVGGQTVATLQFVLTSDGSDNRLQMHQHLTIRKKADLSLVFDGDMTAVDLGSGAWEYRSEADEAQLVLTDGTEYYIYIDQFDVLSTNMDAISWEETSAPNQQFKFDAATMPHTFTKAPNILGSPEFNFSVVDWDERNAGDDDTNPQPAFINKSITDMAIFQNRLVTLVEDEIATSETDNTFSFFRNTVTQLLSTHPVRIRSTSTDTKQFNNMLNHNRDLLLFTEDSQFKLSGDIAMTPQTSGLPQTGTYSNIGKVQPASIGDSVVFATSYGKHSGLKRYESSGISSDDTDFATSMTEHVKKLIKGDIFRIIGNSTVGKIYVVADDKKTLFVCDYDTKETRNEIKRFAWSKYTLPLTFDYEILEISEHQGDIYLVINVDNLIHVTKFEGEDDPEADEHKVYLDWQVTTTVTFVNTGLPGRVIIDSHYPVDDIANIVPVMGTDSDEAGNIPDHTLQPDIGFGEYFDIGLDDSLVGDTITYGIPYRCSIKPSTLYVRDESGKINTQTNLRISRFIVFLQNSATVYGKIISNFYNFADQFWSGLISGNINTQTDNVADNTEQFVIAYRQKNTTADLEIYSDSHLPMNITQIDYVGNYTSRGRRL